MSLFSFPISSCKALICLLMVFSSSASVIVAYFAMTNFKKTKFFAGLLQKMCIFAPKVGWKMCVERTKLGVKMCSYV
jgi:hypothetical protein